MQSHREIRSETRHNRRALRWVPLAVIVILLAVASYTHFARRGEAVTDAQRVTQPTPQAPPIDSGKQ